MSQLPDIPTFDELGFKDIHAEAYAGIVVPAGTPADIIAKLQKAVAESVADPSIQKRLIDIGQEPVGGSSQQFADVLSSDTTRWHKLIKDLNITLD
jgi:tripartite-type tricarboxylate transporter receptor subunit TctC